MSANDRASLPPFTAYSPEHLTIPEYLMPNFPISSGRVIPAAYNAKDSGAMPSGTFPESFPVRK